ncbi:MAG: transcription antitermination factor NusB [Bacteroidales bacterium]|nr:transcription antitermination factor NusB [Bacteroidales bacterium]
MLSRRYLRIKVLQSIYAFFQSNNDRIDVGERQLLTNLNKIFELYIHQISLLLAIVNFAKQRQEESKKKYFPTENDINPNRKFVDNRFIAQIAANREFLKKEDALRISWKNEEELIRRIYGIIRQSNDFVEYMNSSDESYKADKEIIVKIFMNYIADSESLQYYFEEKNINWVVDYPTSIMMLIKTINSFKESDDEFKALPKLFKSEESKDNEDVDFIIRLFRKSILNREKFSKMISEKVKNWEIERLAIMDIIILVMAMTEMIEFPSIPIKVTFNEYIDISKNYSTPKSKVFINGMLDKLYVELKEKNKIKKTGRGLIE